MTATERVRSALAGLPDRLTRGDLERELRARLASALGLAPSAITLGWVLDTVTVTIPSRPHYLNEVAAIGQLISETTMRVDLTDVVQLSDADHLSALRSLRDGS